MLDCPDNILRSEPVPMSKSMPIELFFAGLELFLLVKFIHQPAVENETFNLAVIPLIFLWVVLLAVFLFFNIRGITAQAIGPVHVFIDGVKRKSITGAQ